MHGARPFDKNSKGMSVGDCVSTDWIRAILKMDRRAGFAPYRLEWGDIGARCRLRALLMTLTHRLRIPEIMDDPGLDSKRHFAALRALARINAISGTWRALAAPILDLARRVDCKELRILDVATGGGDVPIGLWRHARRRGLNLNILGVDISPRAIEFARSRANACGAAVEFAQLDVLAGELPVGFDVVTCCLFLHHLDEPDVVSLLRSMARASNHLVLASDLVRTRVGLMLAYFATWALTFSEVARVDGARSVRAAFSLPEIRTLAANAGLNGAIVRRSWPCRYIMSWTGGNITPGCCLKTY